MSRSNCRFKRLKVLFLHWRNQLLGSSNIFIDIPRLFGYLRDMKKYSKIKGSEPIKLINIYPCLHDKINISSFDIHYFYQDIWAFKKIYESNIRISY